MSGSITADQLELIKDDPRREPKKSPLAILRELKHARETHGELLTPALAARILDCSSGQIHVWMSRGRLTLVEIGENKFVPGAEIEALYEERKKDLPKGGRGHKLPSLSEVIKLSQKAE